MVDRLRDFVVPYQYALETKAGQRTVYLYLTGLLSPLGLPPWHKTSALSPLICAMLTPGHAMRVCATGQRGLVSPMRDGLEARVMIYDAPRRVRRKIGRA